MNYELAKELKEAGFPQADFRERRSGGAWYDEDGDISEHCTDDPCYYIPTLSELIEACGEGFASLHKVPEGWVAYSTIKDGLFTEIASSDPGTCVARLWLAIHTPKPEQP